MYLINPYQIGDSHSLADADGSICLLKKVGEEGKEGREGGRGEGRGGGGGDGNSLRQSRETPRPGKSKF